MRFAKSQDAAPHGKNRVAVRSRKSDDGIVLVGVDVQMVRRSSVGIRCFDHLCFEALGDLGIVTTDGRGRLCLFALHHSGDGRQRGILV